MVVPLSKIRPIWPTAGEERLRKRSGSVNSHRNVGLSGKIVDNPFLDICRSQIDISFECNSKLVAEQMPGFHWVTVYGDYIKESGYALKKIDINFENLV